MSGEGQSGRGGGRKYGPLGILLMGAGLFPLLMPRMLWDVTRGWKYQNAEPSDLLLACWRVGGGALILAGVVCFFL